MPHGESNFNVTITLGNEAMQTPEDVARALRRIATRLDAGDTSGFYETIHDDNGNDVGRWRYSY